jgi:hypothetical protein
MAGTAIAAPPAPSSGSANVDGTIAEWNVVDDLFSDMIRAGGNGGQTKVESKLYLRYDCTTHTVFANVRAEPGVTIAADLPGESFIKVGGVKKVDGTTGDDGTAPDFSWVRPSLSASAATRSTCTPRSTTAACRPQPFRDVRSPSCSHVTWSNPNRWW